MEAKKGIIFHKLRNSRAAAKKAVDLPENEDTLSEKDLKTLLKYCVVKNDKQKLKKALCKTVSMRRKLLAEDDPELMEFWRFYFVDIEMVTDRCAWRIVIRTTTELLIQSADTV